MTELLGPRDVQQLAAPLNLHPAKALGQNFVVDPNTIRRIVRLADLPPEAEVLEVGPGLGSLTLGLLAAGHRVTAVEIDERLARLLPDTVDARLPEGAARLRVVAADAISIDAGLGVPDSLVANLPYNVAVPVLLHCLATFPSLERSWVMVQKEVADRLAAAPGSKTYGVPSVKAAWYARVRRVGSVPPTVFWPVPRVDSGLVLLVAHRDPADVRGEQPRDRVFAVIDLLFGQRRKTVRHTLTARLGPEVADSALARAGLAPGDRPEQWGLAQFVQLAAALPKSTQSHQLSRDLA